MASRDQDDERLGRPPDADDNETEALLSGQEQITDNESKNKRRKLLAALPALLLCTFIVSFDTTYMIGNYATQIAASLHETNHAAWLILGWTVTESACLPMYGQAAQVYGRRLPTIFAATATCIGFALSALCTHLLPLALARVVVGLGTSGLDTLKVVIINDLVQLYDLALWKSALVATDTIGLMLGPPTGSALNKSIGFRGTFGIESAAMLITAIALYFTLFLHKPKKSPSNHKVQRLEWQSSILLLLAVATPLFAINLGGATLPWSHPAIITMLCLTPFLIALFYWRDSRLAVTPLLPKRFLKDRSILVLLLATLPLNFVWDQLQFTFGTYLEARSFHSPNPFVDWALTCVFLGRPIGIFFSGFYIKRYRAFKRLLSLGIFFDLVIYVVFALGLIQPEKAAFVPFLLFVGAMQGLGEGCYTVAILDLANAADQPLLYGLFDMGIAILGDFGIAVSLAAENGLVQSRLHSNLSGYPKAATIIEKVLQDHDYIKELPRKTQRIVLDAFISSSENAFGISACILVVCLIASFYIKDLSTTKRSMHEQ